MSGVEWEVDYNVVLGDLKQTGGKGVYKASQTLPTALGKKWNIVYKDGVQQLEEVGGAEPGQIVVFNASGEVAMPGMGMSGQASVFKENVLSGSQAQFEVTPTYYAGLFNNVVVGEVISHNVAVGPETLKFPSGLNMATLTAYLDGSSIRLKVAYSQGSSFSMDEVEARITTIEAFNKQAA